MTNRVDDSFDLERFVLAQEPTFDLALAEVRAGSKRSHWMWFIYPQLCGLGHSDMAKRYGITNVREALAYLEHPILGQRLIEISEAALSVSGRSATEIFGRPDDMKLRSCATLFSKVSNADSVFQRLIDKYFDGEADEATLMLLNSLS